MRKPVDNFEKRRAPRSFSVSAGPPAILTERQIGGQIDRPPKDLSLLVESQICAIDFRSAFGDCI